MVSAASCCRTDSRVGDTFPVKVNSPDLRTRLYLAAGIILLAGLGSAILIYVTAGEAPDTIPGYDPEDTKTFLHDLELYGGKINLLTAEFMRWFAGLWQGRSLAGTIAFLSLVISAGLWFVARHAPAGPETGGTDTDDRVE